MTLELGTIEQEAAACRERWKGYDTGTLAAHAHHEIPFEVLTQPSETRIAYILSKKPENERALRLRCFAPVDMSQFPMPQKARTAWEKVSSAWLKACAEAEEISAAWLNAESEREKIRAEWRKARAEWLKVVPALEEICGAIPHAELCPLGSDCPWDGKTIFREAK